MHDIIASDTFDKQKLKRRSQKWKNSAKLTCCAHGNPEQDLQHPDAGTEKAINANFEKRLTERPAAKGKMPQLLNNLSAKKRKTAGLVHYLQ